MKGKFIIYQILLRVFANTNDRCVSGGSLQLNGSGKFSDITDELLASLRTLSVTHIWYTGVIEHATASAFPEIGLIPYLPGVNISAVCSPFMLKCCGDHALHDIQVISVSGRNESE